MDTVIECENIKRTFVSITPSMKRQETVALNGLSFTVRRGTVFGLLGPNGSGKTTTIRILSTLLTPTSGRALVCGYDVVRDAGKVRKQIGLILSGDRGFYGRLTGYENLRYFAALNHLTRNLAQRRIKEAIELVGLSSASNRLVEQYSRGMRQRLHIARGLLSDPDLIFMDEPTIGLDPVGAQELRQLVPDLVRNGKTIMLTTHYMHEADQLCEEITIINNGELVASGTPSGIKKKFSKVAIIEVNLRQIQSDAVKNLLTLNGVERVISNTEGLLQKLTVYHRPDEPSKAEVVNILGENNIESIILREPTLEEAYLSIIKE